MSPGLPTCDLHPVSISASATHPLSLRGTIGGKKSGIGRRKKLSLCTSIVHPFISYPLHRVMDTGRPVDTMDTLDDSNKLNIVSRASLVALLNWKMWQFLASPKNSRLAMLWNKLVFTWKAFECVLIAYSRLHFLVCLHTCQQCSLPQVFFCDN